MEADEEEEDSDIELIDEMATTVTGSGRKRKAASAVNRDSATKSDATNTKIVTATNKDESSNGAGGGSGGDSAKKFKNQVTSTPAQGGQSSVDRRKRLVRDLVDEGMFFGKTRHADGKLIRVIYQRKYISDDLIGVWISRDPYSDKSIIDCSIDQSMVRYNQAYKRI